MRQMATARAGLVRLGGDGTPSCGCASVIRACHGRHYLSSDAFFR